MSAAALDHTDSILVDAWRCSECGGLTFDASKFEIPTFCCRCGRKFTTVDYKDTEIRKDANE